MTTSTHLTGNPRTAAYRAGGRRFAEAEKQPKRTVITGGKPNCVHHWVIDAPVPGVRGANGICKRCEARRHFEHAADGWERESWNAGPASLAGRLSPTVDQSDWAPADER
ncbi:MAG: hypothetical protein AMXMBFR23_16780 [Chloroflexota bacterium]